MVRVCFVCLGNICRSPTAEGVFQKMVNDAGLEADILIDSAGTAAYHTGERADARSRDHAARRGYDLRSRARPFEASDFADFDLVLAMDASNLDDLLRLAPDRGARDRIRLFRDFDAASPKGSSVPDPYYGGDRGFEEVLDICEAGCRGLLDHLRQDHHS